MTTCSTRWWCRAYTVLVVEAAGVVMLALTGWLLRPQRGGRKP